VHRKGSQAIWIVTELRSQDRYVDLFLEHTDLEWFCYPIEELRGRQA